MVNFREIEINLIFRLAQTLYFCRRVCVIVFDERVGGRSKHVWLTRAERREVRHALAADQTVNSDTHGHMQSHEMRVTTLTPNPNTAQSIHPYTAR